MSESPEDAERTRQWEAEKDDYFANPELVRTHLSVEVGAMLRIGEIIGECGRDSWPRIAAWVAARYGDGEV